MIDQITFRDRIRQKAGPVQDDPESKKLHQAYAACFDTPAGRQVLEDLKTRTIQSVCSIGVDPTSLMHLEGQRWIVGIIDNFVERGRHVGKKR